jgi:hypothetical protein
VAVVDDIATRGADVNVPAAGENAGAEVVPDDTQ